MSHKDHLGCMTNSQILTARDKTTKVVRESYRQSRPLQAQANQEIVELYDEVLEDRWLRLAPAIRIEADGDRLAVTCPTHALVFAEFKQQRFSNGARP
jgi:predicted SnoaL-like aldol condensation-catalyzing enzyme